MAENTSELTQDIINKITSNIKKLYFQFNEPLKCTAANLSRFHSEAFRQVEHLIQSRDVVVDVPLRSIYLSEDVPLNIICLLPIRYPEMDKIEEPKTFKVFQTPCKKPIGTVSYNGPAENGPDYDIIHIGYKTEFVYNGNIEYYNIDLDLREEIQDE